MNEDNPKTAYGFSVGQMVTILRADTEGERAVIEWFSVAPNGHTIAKTRIAEGPLEGVVVVVRVPGDIKEQPDV